MTETTPTTTPTPPEGLTDEQLKDIWETGHLPTDQEIADDHGVNDLLFMFTSAYYRWLDENPEEQEKHDAKCLRAVFNAGVNWSRHTPAPAPTPEEIEAQFRAWWAESYPNAPAGPHAVSSHVAFALHLLSRGVQ